MILIFTDLDGTLLDYSSYRPENAQDTLNKLKGMGIPIIFVTSKTFRETVHIQNILNIHDPFVVENGGGIFFKKGYRNFKINSCNTQNGYCAIKLGRPYIEVRKVFEKLKVTYPVKGFGDMDIDEISKLTGLSPEDAEKAKERQFSEPFTLKDSSLLERLKKDAEKLGMKVIQGGILLHLMSYKHDKGKAVNLIKSIFAKNTRGKPVSIGLGDSPNDEEMLRNVDIPVIIPNPRRKNYKPPIKNLKIAESYGSMGWSRSLEEIINELEKHGN